MIVSYEISSEPVVYLSAKVADEETQDAVVVEGQEELEAEAESVDVAEEETATDENAEETSAQEEKSSDEEKEESEGEEAAEGTDGEDLNEETEGENAEGEESNVDIGGEGADGENIEGQDTEGMEEDGMTAGDGLQEETAAVKDPLLSSPVAVCGISLAVVVVGCVLGFVLAKRKIKKGIEVYEDF